MDAAETRERVREMMPTVVDDLAGLVGHASVAFPGFPAEPVRAAAEATVAMFHRAGVPQARLLDVDGAYPAVYADVPGPPGAPTVLLYAHYDVQPAKREDGWTSDPFVLTERGGRLYGRGAADDKSGVVMHAAALRACGGVPPVGVRVVIEGEEETASRFDAFVGAHPELFRANLVIVADMGDLEVGRPVLTTTLRGEISATVTVSTLPAPLHSGVFGGPAPDAMLALVRLLDRLYDEDGAVAVPGLRRFDWRGADWPEEDYRRTSGLPADVRLVGRGSVATRLWSSPSLTVTGVDAPPVDQATNALVAHVRAKLSLRLAPGDDPVAAGRRLEQAIRDATPWGAHVAVDLGQPAPSFTAATGGPGYAAARRALADAFGAVPGEVGSGGSIPLLGHLAAAVPGAEFVLLGAEDAAQSRIHGVDESVDRGELERMIVAETLTLRYLAENWR